MLVGRQVELSVAQDAATQSAQQQPCTAGPSDQSADSSASFAYGSDGGSAVSGAMANGTSTASTASKPLLTKSARARQAKKRRAARAAADAASGRGASANGNDPTSQQHGDLSDADLDHESGPAISDSDNGQPDRPHTGPTAPADHMPGTAEGVPVMVSRGFLGDGASNSGMSAAPHTPPRQAPEPASTRAELHSAEPSPEPASASGREMLSEFQQNGHGAARQAAQMPEQGSVPLTTGHLDKMGANGVQRKASGGLRRGFFGVKAPSMSSSRPNDDEPEPAVGQQAASNHHSGAFQVPASFAAMNGNDDSNDDDGSFTDDSMPGLEDLEPESAASMKRAAATDVPASTASKTSSKRDATSHASYTSGTHLSNCSGF